MLPQERDIYVTVSDSSNQQNHRWVNNLPLPMGISIFWSTGITANMIYNCKHDFSFQNSNRQAGLNFTLRHNRTDTIALLLKHSAKTLRATLFIMPVLDRASCQGKWMERMVYTIPQEGAMHLSTFPSSNTRIYKYTVTMPATSPRTLQEFNVLQTKIITRSEGESTNFHCCRASTILGHEPKAPPHYGTIDRYKSSAFSVLFPYIFNSIEITWPGRSRILCDSIFSRQILVVAFPCARCKSYVSALVELSRGKWTWNQITLKVSFEYYFATAKESCASPKR